MAAQLELKDDIKDNVAILSIRYGPEANENRDDLRTFSAQLVARYRDLIKKDSNIRSCIVEIFTEIAGSGLIRGLFELYKTVRANGGELICVNFPSDFVPSLAALGLLDQPKFSLSSNTDQALRKLTPATA